MAFRHRVGWYLLVSIGLAATHVAATPIVVGPADVVNTISVPSRTVVPAPSSRLGLPGGYRITADSAIAATPAAVPVAQYLQKLLTPVTGFAVPLEAQGNVQLIVEPGHPDGGYELKVSPSGIWMAASEPAGLFEGVQTLRQLLPAPAKGHAVPAIASTIISDHPRFTYRGAMLDVARHFFGVADVKRYIDDIAMVKINVLHLHLSDDQGWRLQIDSWPRLTGIGGSSQVGGGPGGFYTKSQYRDIVDYAASRYITIVPEFDMPGHTNAALAAYPELSCNGRPRNLYTGMNVGFSTLCTSAETTYRFVADVVKEVAALTPGPWLNIGGDESAATPPAEYRSFVERATGIVAEAGKTPVGWLDIGRATKLPPGTIGQYWDFTVPRGDTAANAERILNGGGKLIMAPANVAYLDMEYYAGAQLGTNWALGPTTIEQAYGWDPAGILPGVGDDNILGVEAPLWSETFSTLSDLEFLAFPRIVAIAEIGWSAQPDKSTQPNRSFAEFAPRLAAFGQYLDAAGVNYYRTPGVPWK